MYPSDRSTPCRRMSANMCMLFGIMTFSDVKLNSKSKKGLHRCKNLEGMTNARPSLSRDQSYAKFYFVI